MSLKYTLLGFLSFGPMTGYELKKQMDQSTQLFWHAALSQIYPTLKRLEEQGLVTFDVEPQSGKPDKKIYTLSEAGQEDFMTWLSKPVDKLSPRKVPVLLKLFFSGVLDKETVLTQLRHQQALHRVQLAYYEQEIKPYIEQMVEVTGMVREGVMWELTRQLGEENERTYLRWLEQAIETVEEKL